MNYIISITGETFSPQNPFYLGRFRLEEFNTALKLAVSPPNTAAP